MRNNHRTGGTLPEFRPPCSPAGASSDPGRALSGPRPPRDQDDQATTLLAFAARSGEAEALDAFVRSTRDDVWRFVASLAEPKFADDLTQETYLRALRALGRFAGRSHARPWLLAIARRVVADHYRSRGARPAHVVDWQGEPEPRRRHSTSSFEDEFALVELLHRLTDGRREAFLLTQVAGFSYQEAAAMTGCPVGTVRSRVARARRDLITALREPELGLEPAGRPL